MRTKARDGFIKALRDAHRWLDELLFDPTQTIESLAVRESKSERSIRMTLSLAFISPVLAEAAMEGRLPRGFGAVTNVCFGRIDPFTTPSGNDCHLRLACCAVLNLGHVQLEDV
jgi:hypothetical protein